MFGYVVVNKSELKFKEFDQYRRYYCGLCRRLKERYGRRGQISLSYDMTFLVLLLSGLYEPEEIRGSRRCPAHPWKKQEYIYNICTDYAADMGILLMYYKCMDDYRDEKKLFRKIYGERLLKANHTLQETYADKIREIETWMNRLKEQEAAEGAQLDDLADCFGQMLARVFSMKEDVWKEKLECIGYHLGKFIYILDGYDDLERDRKKGCFNPLLGHVEEMSQPEAWLEDVLRATIAPAAHAFEKLPVIKEAGILRNILYSGIWSRFLAVKERKEKKEH